MWTLPWQQCSVTLCFAVAGAGATLRQQGSLGSFSNGLDHLDQPTALHCLNPDDIIEKYKEAITHYSKVGLSLSLCHRKGWRGGGCLPPVLSATVGVWGGCTSLALALCHLGEGVCFSVAGGVGGWRGVCFSVPFSLSLEVWVDGGVSVSLFLSLCHWGCGWMEGCLSLCLFLSVTGGVGGWRGVFSLSLGVWVDGGVSVSLCPFLSVTGGVGGWRGVCLSVPFSLSLGVWVGGGVSFSLSLGVWVDGGVSVSLSLSLCHWGCGWVEGCLSLCHWGCGWVEGCLSLCPFLSVTGGVGGWRGVCLSVPFSLSLGVWVGGGVSFSLSLGVWVGGGVSVSVPFSLSLGVWVGGGVSVSLSLGVWVDGGVSVSLSLSLCHWGCGWMEGCLSLCSFLSVTGGVGGWGAVFLSVTGGVGGWRGVCLSVPFSLSLGVWVDGGVSFSLLLGVWVGGGVSVSLSLGVWVGGGVSVSLSLGM